MLNLTARFAFFLITMCSLIGCNSGTQRPQIVEVQGQVLLDEKPVSGARVVFVPDTGMLRSEDYALSYGVTDDAGDFTLKFADGTAGALAGQHRVYISKSNFLTENLITESTATESITSVDGGETVDGDSPRWEAPNDQIPSAEGEQIPFYYNSRSQLMFEVRSGQGIQRPQFKLSSIDPLLK